MITTEFTDWATDCPEYKVTAVQVWKGNRSASEGPGTQQKDPPKEKTQTPQPQERHPPPRGGRDREKV